MQDCGLPPHMFEMEEEMQASFLFTPTTVSLSVSQSVMGARQD